MNALISITEINSLYDQRPVIEKQASYAFVHPFAEALGGIVADIPVKFVSAVVFNIIFYFLASLVCFTHLGISQLVLTLCSDTNLLNSSSSSSSPFSVR
jgi:ABC-type multidrug transport system permease subunit